MGQDKKLGTETVKYTVSSQHGTSGRQAPHSAKARYSHTIIITLNYIIIIIIIIIIITTTTITL
jgi:hypothetical protein